MSRNKARMLENYINKKDKMLKRKQLLAEITEIDKERSNSKPNEKTNKLQPNYKKKKLNIKEIESKSSNLCNPNNINVLHCKNMPDDKKIGCTEESSKSENAINIVNKNQLSPKDSKTDSKKFILIDNNRSKSTKNDTSQIKIDSIIPKSALSRTNSMHKENKLLLRKSDSQAADFQIDKTFNARNNTKKIRRDLDESKSIEKNLENKSTTSKTHPENKENIFLENKKGFVDDTHVNSMTNKSENNKIMIDCALSSVLFSKNFRSKEKECNSITEGKNPSKTDSGNWFSSTEQFSKSDHSSIKKMYPDAINHKECKEKSLEKQINWDCKLNNNFPSKNLPIFTRIKQVQEKRKELPVFYEESTIITLIRENDVIFIQGTTGSGKTTQIPQFLLENNIQENKKIAITEPRRILATVLSKRLNKELNMNVAGYKIRYEDTTTKSTKIKVMTDGILLKEMQSDFLLSSYSVVIIDEAHERNANMDVIVCLLSKVVNCRKKQNDPLKIIIMSASSLIDEIGSVFDCKIGKYVLESKQYKVHIRYEKKTDLDYLSAAYNKIMHILELARKNDTKFTEKILKEPRKDFWKKCNAESSGLSCNEDKNNVRKYSKGTNSKFSYSKNHKELFKYEKKSENMNDNNYSEKQKHSPLRKEEITSIDQSIYFENLPPSITNNSQSAILVFLPSKDEIYDLKNRLSKLQDIEIIPLHSKMNTTEQKAIFKNSNKRKVILATNIAESSITIPNVTFVIDTGRAKYKNYMKNNVFSYKIDFISKSHALQRSGRTGRCRDGVCYRLYSPQMFEEFDDVPVPEICDSPLDNLMLTLMTLGIKNPLDFPFITKPAQKNITGAFSCLKKLGALDEDLTVTELGYQMSRYPVTPRLARFLCVKSKFEKDICLMVSILCSELEIKRNSDNADFFRNCNSEILAKINIFLAYSNSKNKEEFCSQMQISSHCLIEIQKLYYHLLKIKQEFAKIKNNQLVSTAEFTQKSLNNSYKEDNKPYEGDLIKLQQEHNYLLKTNFLSLEAQTELIKIIHCGFSENIAVKVGNQFYFRGDPVYISKDTIDCHHAKSVVFEYLIEGRTKKYMKNTTIIEEN